jgi:hypothetical protein
MKRAANLVFKILEIFCIKSECSEFEHHHLAQTDNNSNNNNNKLHNVFRKTSLNFLLLHLPCKYPIKIVQPSLALGSVFQFISYKNTSEEQALWIKGGAQPIIVSL